MKTEDLITTLSADTERPAGPDLLLPLALLAGALAEAALMLGLLGPRADLAAVLDDAALYLKPGLMAALTAAGLGLVLRMSRPGAGTGNWLAGIAAVAVALAALMGGEVLRLPGSALPGALHHRMAMGCLATIVVLSVPIAAICFAVLRRGAPTRPGLCGAAAGMTSAAAAATVFTLRCTGDSPLFYGTWYTVAILGVTAAGWVAGRRLLRW